MASKPAKPGLWARVLVLLGKVLRRIENRLHGYQTRLLAQSNAEDVRWIRLEEIRRRRLNVMFDRAREVNESVKPTLDKHGDPSTPTVTKIGVVEREVLIWAAEDAFFRALADDRPFDEAVITAIRRLTAKKHSQQALRRARTIAHNLRSREEFREVGTVASALVAFVEFVPGTAWEYFHQVDPAVVMRLAPDEYFRTGFRNDPEAAVETLRDVLAGSTAMTTGRTTWLEIAKLSFAADYETESQQALEHARELGEQTQDEELLYEVEWLARWYGRKAAARVPAENPAGTIPFAVIDYKQPDKLFSSANLGDHVQTIASLGHVVRHQNFTFGGDPELVDVLETLKARVKPERVIADTPAAELTLYRADRDATNYFQFPEGTWLIAFGWYMHQMFKMKYDAPLNPQLRPIFVSFHVNELPLLSDDMIEYLKKYAPIGCRDWNTVHVLTAAGVPAFFSGCLTTTVDTVFPAEPVGRGKGTLWVDVPNPGEGDRWEQSNELYRRRDFRANVLEALDRLESYRSSYDRVVSSRLHCYLPARSIGSNIVFRPRNPSDVRFDGLMDITDEAYDAIRSGIRDKLAQVMAAIAAGRSEDEVYALWREICAPDVARAQELRANVPEIAPPSFDVAAACREVLARSVTVERREPGPAGDEVNVEFSLDGNLKHQLAVVLESVVSSSSRPVRAYVLCRDHDQADFDRMAAAFPTVSFVWLPTDDVDYGDIIGMIEHITVATMDRLLLPELLPDVDRIIHHDLDALCLADIAELYDTPLGDTPIAARTSPQPGSRLGFNGFKRSAQRLKNERDLARELILRTHTRHAFDFEGFNAGIMVLNLDRMRRDEFCRHFLPYAERFGMNDQDILNAYAGADRVHLDDDWNRLPRIEVVDHPKIVHWAGFQKPWAGDYVQFQEQWDEVDARVSARL